MDGPQLKDRWGARYAASLADDPGSSVLTLTSLGMSTLSNPYGAVPRSRVVALWKDAKAGATEIELPPGYDAIVISISVESAEEWSADGRSDEGATGYPLLSGVYPVKIASN
jgi:hypothetical protein